MKKMDKGVSLCGTPFFLVSRAYLGRRFFLIWMLLSLTAAFFIPMNLWAVSTVMHPESPTTGGRAVIHADELIYHEEDGRLYAEGNVRVWYQDMTLTAQKAEADLDTQLVKAQGDVNLIEAERDINCAELLYDLKTRSATAKGILFATHPWYYQGESVEKIGDKEVIINHARFSTCNARHPHYHLKARKIEIVLGDAMIAHDATLYVGSTPVFYLPWFRRSINDNRPPFSIRVGYNDFEGFFAKTKYNYFFSKKNYGNINLDLMEKKGLGTGLDHYLDYSFLGEGRSEIRFLYILDSEDENEQITGRFNTSHSFSNNDDLKINLDYLSNRGLNREFSSILVDSYQQKSSIYYNHRNPLYNFNVSMQEHLSYDPLRSAKGQDIYYTSLRELPNITLSLLSRKVTDFLRPVYFNMSSGLSRTYPRIITNDYSVNEVIQHRYQNDFYMTPALTQNYQFPLWVITQPTLSWSLGTPLRGSYKEKLIPEKDTNDHYAELNGGYRTNITLSNKWVNYIYTKPTHLLESRLSHGFQRDFDMIYRQSIANSGVTSNNLRLDIDYDMGNFLHTNVNTAYDLQKKDHLVNWRDPFSDPAFSGRLAIFSATNINWQGNYSLKYDEIDRINFGISHYGRRWSANVNTSYSQTFNIITEEKLMQSIFMTLYASAQPEKWGLGINGSVQYDAVKHEFTNFSIGATRDLHCWTMQGSLKVYQDGNISVGFGMTIKAFPEMKIGMPGMGGMSLGE